MTATGPSRRSPVTLIEPCRLPITLPPFAQYQGPLVPLRGLWNAKPKDGDRFVNVELDWVTATGGKSSVYINCASSSAVPLSQIVALYVDNSRCGSDIDFLFPDSAFQITVPGNAQALFPVMTNSLGFYATAPAPAAGDVTIVQICNSMPPPIPLLQARSQNADASVGVSVATNSTTVIVAAGINGSLNAFSIGGGVTGGASAGAVTLTLQDGTGKKLWQSSFTTPASVRDTLQASLSGLDQRFVNGISLIVSAATNLTGTIVCNVYYTTP